MAYDGHDPRCERSATKRCRCDCQGRLHGVEATHIDLGGHRLDIEPADEDRPTDADADVAPPLGQQESVQLTLDGAP